MISKQAENYFRTRVFRKSSNRLITITVNGNSMWPFLKHGQEIIIRMLKQDESYNIGDIVVIKVRSFFLIHRVLFKRKTKGGKRYQYFTKGDRRLVGDGWVNEVEIVGKTINECRFKNLSKVAALVQSEILLLGGIILRRR